MARVKRQRFVPALVGILCALPALAACGGGNPEPTPTTAPVVTTASGAPATAIPPAIIEPIVWAERIVEGTNAPESIVDRFSTASESIYAVVHTENLAPGVVLTANWTYNNTSLDNATRAFVLAGGYDAGYVEFHLTRSADALWPEGNYAVTIALDGQVMQSAQIDVVDD